MGFNHCWSPGCISHESRKWHQHAVEVQCLFYILTPRKLYGKDGRNLESFSAEKRWAELLYPPCWGGRVSCHLIDLAVHLFQLRLSLAQWNSLSGHVFSVCSPAADPCSCPTTAGKTLLVRWVRQACPLHCCRTESLTPQAVLLFKRTEHFSRKEQLLPALVVLLSWPLLCADSRADFVRGCSHAERGEQEELSHAAGLCLLLLWLWFNHRWAALYPSTLKEGKKCPHSLSVNGTWSQRCFCTKRRPSAT